MLRLDKSILEKLKDDEPFQLRVRATIGVSHNTMMKYIQENHSRFTELDCINFIAEELQQPLSEIITGGKLSKLLAK